MFSLFSLKVLVVCEDVRDLEALANATKDGVDATLISGDGVESKHVQTRNTTRSKKLHLHY